MDPKGFDRVAFSFEISVGNLIDNVREKALYVCENLKKCVCVLEKKKCLIFKNGRAVCVFCIFYYLYYYY